MSSSGLGSDQTGGGVAGAGQMGRNLLAPDPPGGSGSGGGSGGGGGGRGNPPAQAMGVVQAGVVPVANGALKGHPSEVFNEL
jgi:hypothetical protein